MTQLQEILDYLWSIAPSAATNAQIAHGTGIRSHQAVYMATQDLLRQGRVRSERTGKVWMFSAIERPEIDLGNSPSATTNPAGYTRQPLSAARFEEIGRIKLGERYGTPLGPGSLARVPKRFDFVSGDGRIVGDAKYYTLVRGVALPPAKFSVIAEHVWLLERTGAPILFLVFGNERRVPMRWLERYGHLAGEVAFYFLTDSGELQDLR